jgi:uncharacterized protein with FMN-binding domain
MAFDFSNYSYRNGSIQHNLQKHVTEEKAWDLRHKKYPFNSSGVHLDTLRLAIVKKEPHMAKNQSQQAFNLTRAVKKLFLSSFVVFSFIAYAIQQRFAKPDSAFSLAPTPTSTPTQEILAPTSVDAAQPAQSTAGTQPTAETPPTAVPPSPAPILGMYKDGTYTGATVDAYYGLVEVQVSVRNGKIADVQFLQYPNDRRTSVEINSQAMPWLQQEAIQAQSANVNIISGATFTSEGFAMSLDAALKNAKN